MVFGLLQHALLITVIGMILLAGCSGSNSQDGHYAIRGTVTLDGEPLAAGSVTFSSTDPQRRGAGSVISDGKYEIPAAKGLVEGEYLVLISATDQGQIDNGEARARMLSQPGGAKAQKEIIPAEYNTQSKIKRRVQDGAPNVFDFDIEKE